MSVKEDLLMELLDCGSADLDMLEDVHYPLYEVLDQIDYSDGGRFTFNDLMRAVVDVGIIYIQEAISDRICEIDAISCAGRPLEPDEEEELHVLQNVLNPDDDIKGFFNCLDTYVYFQNNAEEYHRYLPEAIGSFEDNTGLHISD